MKISPIVLFAYNRPNHTKAMLETLSNCELFNKSDIYIFLDGPKFSAEDKYQVNKVSILVNCFKKKFKNVKVKKSHKNLGLFKNLTKGISLILKKNDSIIILEDDLKLHKKFLVFMNRGLNLYKKNKKILQISGYSYPIKVYNNKTYLLNLTSCWGWGIWRDRWSKVEKFINNKDNIYSSYLKIKNDKRLSFQFNIEGSFDYLKFLKKQININFNSWGVLFYLYSFQNNCLNLFPPKSLVNNLGFDGTGLHKSKSNIFNSINFKKNISFSFDKRIYDNQKNLKKISSFLKRELSLYSKIIRIVFK